MLMAIILWFWLCRRRCTFKIGVAGHLLGANFVTFMLFLTIFYMPASFQSVSTSALVGLIYVSLFSMLHLW